MVESNDVGEATCDAIWYEYENENLMNCDKKGLGIRSTKSTKKYANLLLKRYMESGWMKLVDERTLYELSRYEEIRPNVFGAGRKDHDDCVTSLLWSLYYVVR